MSNQIADDVLSLMAISLGTMLAVSATASLQPERAPAPVTEAVVFTPRLEIDFAIIREPIEIMVGPENERTGWAPRTDAIREDPRRR